MPESLTAIPIPYAQLEQNAWRLETRDDEEPTFDDESHEATETDFTDETAEEFEEEF